MSGRDLEIDKLKTENELLKAIIQERMSGSVRAKRRRGENDPNNKEEVRERITRRLKENSDMTLGVLRNTFRTTEDSIFDSALSFLVEGGFIHMETRKNKRHRVTSYICLLEEYHRDDS